MLKNLAFWALIVSVVTLAQALGGWQSQGAAMLLIIFALVLLIGSSVVWLGLPETMRWTSTAVKSLTLGRSVALPIAARIAYEEARAHDTIWAHAAERLAVDKTPDGILDYVAGYIAGEAQIYGRRPPSTRLEPIAKVQAQSGTFYGGAKILRLRDGTRTEYSHLQVSRKDLRIVRRQMREAMSAGKDI
ncbi:hypothetical protein [Cupriavidus pinatubonensis]|uniref:Transmembrane protein n=1 Tax=Cupriavidus pinatubonensis TaxID=248026 RepID=A0ABN7YDX1_9BURK|nr:hypothetical protein [Cupriavidus pinatubonensis]CAG9170407.1 hypothetical protein LMG23994_01883 [Cupriavidus pinatubonensis]